jgi:hypothetical protein
VRIFAAVIAAGALSASSLAGGRAADVVQSVGGISASVAGRFRNPIGFQQSASGQYFVFDRRAHTVYGIDEHGTDVWEIVRIGAEPGRIIDPTAFCIEPKGTFVVADAPANRERIQLFASTGLRLGGFTVPGTAKARIVLDNLVLNGIGSLQYTGTSILMSQPETGALITEYTPSGAVSRTFGALRATNHDDDHDLTIALNSGLPLVDPLGGFYFVFETGLPVFRKYDATGHLLFERHIEGREIDEHIDRLPTVWPRRKSVEGELPVVPPTIRTAAVDASGRLWISLVAPYTYIYDRDGDKIRTLQFRAAGVIAPDSLFFGPEGRLLVTPGLYEFEVRE